MQILNLDKENRYSHDRIQQEVFNHCFNRYPETRGCMWHTPNEYTPHAKETKAETMKRLSERKRIGVLKGVLDLCLYWKGTLYILDVKIGTDTLSDAQLSFIRAIVAQGGQFYEINSVEHGKEIIDFIMKK